MSLWGRRIHGGGKDLAFPANFHFLDPAILGAALAKGAIDKPAKKPGVELPGGAGLSNLK
jgi:hypothetical protein